jgi:hypothetical protein
VAIGSAPEIGVEFKTTGYDAEFFARWRPMVGDDLLGGYAKLMHAPRKEKETKS